jgi:hypothetical protein
MISSSITDMKVGEKKCRNRFHDIFTMLVICTEVLHIFILQRMW